MRLNRFLVHASILAIALSLTDSVWAQAAPDVPSSANAARLSNPDRPLSFRLDNRAGARPGTAFSQTPTPDNADQIFLTLKKITLSGTEVYAPADLEHFWTDKVGSEIPLSEIYAIADRITKFYQDQGYILARAYIPAQEIESGEVNIAVAEGTIADVFVNGDGAGVLDTAPTITSVHTGIVNAGTYTGNYSVGGGADNNYSFAYTGGNLVVNKKTLLVQAGNQSVAYGNTVPAGNIFYNGFVNGEDQAVLDTAPVIASAMNGIAAPGTYTGNYTVGGAVDNNYTFVYLAGDFIVTGEIPPAPVIPSTVERLHHYQQQAQQVQPFETLIEQPVTQMAVSAGGNTLGGFNSFIEIDPDFARLLNLDCVRAGILCALPGMPVLGDDFGTGTPDSDQEPVAMN